MMMKRHLTAPPILLLLLFFSCSVSGLGSVLHRYYTHLNEYYNWTDAQSKCRSSYTDLALFYKQSDRDSFHFSHYNAWVGLSRGNDWTWTSGGNLNSIKYGPNDSDTSHGCSYYHYSHHRLYGASCDDTYFFICEQNGDYTFVSQTMTWSDAKKYCEEKYYRLANFPNVFDFKNKIHGETFPAWIGLHTDGDSWKWSKGVSDYTNWKPNQTENNGDCVTIFSTTDDMATESCSSKLPVICYRDNLVLVQENKTWEQALEHCRTMSWELVSVQPGEDQEIVVATILEAYTEEVWTGLRFMEGHWWWVNTADMLYTNLPTCPLRWEHCGAVSKNDTVNILTRDCLEKKNFLCYKHY